MYIVNTAYTAAAETQARQILVQATFNDKTELTGKNIIDMTITEATNASGGLSMGATISSKLTMQIKAPEIPLLLEGGNVAPRVGFYGVEDYCPLGKFYITEAESKDDFGTKITITAYDGFSKTEEKYTPKISMPNTAEAILGDIAAQCGFKLAKRETFSTLENGVLIFDSDPEVNNGILIFSVAPDISANGTLISSGNAEYPDGEFELYDWTCRQYIGYFAGLMGKNARFNRDGELAFVWYNNSGYHIPRRAQYMSGLKRTTSGPFVVQSVTSGSSENTLTSGSGVGINFDNPLMTQNILDEIFNQIKGTTYTPATLKWRGNPALEAGDVVMVEDKDGAYQTVYVMEQTLKIGGGLNSEIKCYGASEASIAFSTTPQSQKLQQAYTKLQGAIKEATELLNGSNGGVFEITDGNKDGINDGWIIHSADGQKFIKATVDGIGITTDGGATYQQAMTADGINASAISTGTLNAERIAVENYDKDDPSKLTDYIRFENGTITLGKGDSAIILKLENNQIAFYNTAGTRLGRFTNNSFEIENLQEGQIKFQNFAFLPRTSGNLSFTKLN